MEERHWSLKQVITAFGVTVVVTISLGMIIGYLFFWGQYDKRSVVDQRLDYLERMSLQTEDPSYMIEKGWLYFQKGDLERANALYRQALQLDEDNLVARYNLGLVLMEMGFPEEALEEFNKTVALDNGYYWGYLGQGQVYLALQDYPKAVDHLRQAQRLQPFSANLYYLLGQALEGIQAREEARWAYNEAVKFVSDYPEAKDALQRLESMR